MIDNDKQQPDQPESDRPELDDPLDTGPESDAVIAAEAESAAAASDTFEQAADDLPGAGLNVSALAEDEEESAHEAPVHLERLQKILAKSGIASRRHAEELITSGRVQVNGKVVTELGSKANPARDHIRVDGKLLQGSERHRYFMLNKPKGYVTTVSDPEGRPTIMEFFSKTRERLYPVGRLDYLSEGLLLVTNDGELANKLTRAASGVEKTYLVKISGQPSEEALSRLREGVPIQKGKPGFGRVQTAPAEIRPFHPGKPSGKRGPSRPVDNPWYEVVLIEGRNRELRKMFEEIGHHVEKIRRVGYGPLVLDLEPGKIRELEPEEVEDLRKAAEGKYRKPKTRKSRNREFTPRSDRPTSKHRWNEHQTENRDTVGREERRPFRGNQRGFEQRPESGGHWRPQRNQFRTEPRREFHPEAGRPGHRFSEDRPSRPAQRDDSERRRSFSGTRDNRSASSGERPRSAKPAWTNKPERGSRPPRFERKSGQGRPSQRPVPYSDRYQRPDRGSSNRPVGGKTTDSRSPQRFGGKRSDAPYRFPAKKRLEIRPAEENFDSQSSRAAERPHQRPFQSRSGSRPFRPQQQDRPRGERPDASRFDRSNNEGAAGRTPENRPPQRDRQNRAGFDRPRRESSDRKRPERPERGFKQRSSDPRPAGNFKPGKRGAPGGKQGSTRSGDGRRPGSRAGGNRPGKRRP